VGKIVEGGTLPPLESVLLATAVEHSRDNPQGEIMNRRSFFKYASTAVTLSFLAPLMYRKGSAAALAQDKPPLSESDETAQVFGYKEDNTKVDTTKFPKKAGEAGKNQKCSACSFYSAIDAKHGDCQIFVKNTVNSNGWCNNWEKKG
jgi:hypothetical protein